MSASDDTRSCFHAPYKWSVVYKCLRQTTPDLVFTHHIAEVWCTNVCVRRHQILFSRTIQLKYGVKCLRQTTPDLGFTHHTTELWSTKFSARWHLILASRTNYTTEVCSKSVCARWHYLSHSVKAYILTVPTNTQYFIHSLLRYLQ